MNKEKLKELEEEHHKKLSNLDKTEMYLDEFYYRINRESNLLIETISSACREVPFRSIEPYVFQIEDNLDLYRKQYKQRIEDILEARYQENKRFQEKLDEEQ